MRKYYIIIFCWTLAIMPGLSQNLENIDDLSQRQFLELKGMFSITTNYYVTSRDVQQQNPFRYVLSGSPVLSVYGFDLPLSFTFANENFNVSGPNNFNRVGISPYYKWAKVHAGYRNVAFSPYTLNNHNFLGGGVELNPGKWRLGFVYGRFASAIEEDTTKSQALPPTYKRMGYAFKIGYGTDANYVEFSVLNAKDDPNSISDPVESNVTPAKNLAISLSTRQTISEKLVFEMNLGSSAYTEDLTVSRVELTDYKVPAFIGDLYQPYVSTRMNFAGDASLTYRHELFNLKGEYTRIDPEYETMGSYYFNNDLERYTIGPSFTLWQGKINFSGSMGFQRDNLLDNKAATTNRTIGSANVQFSPFQRFTVNTNYSNYATQQESGLVNINDTIRVYQVNHNINVTPSYMIPANNLYHNFVLAMALQTIIDKNIYTEEFTESETRNANFNYRLRNDLIKYGMSGGLNYLTLNSPQTEISRFGFSLGGEKDLFEEKLSLRLNGMFNFSERDGKSDGNVINGSFDVSYMPHEKHNFSIRSQAIFNRTSVQYDDYVISANYTFTL